jgi:hypothetical protein
VQSSDFLGGTTRPNYLYARKKISERKIVLWYLEVERHAFFRKSRKRQKNGLRAIAKGSDFVFMQNKVYHAS